MLDQQVRLVLRERQEQPAHRARQVLQGRWVLQERQELLDHKERQAQQAHKE